MQEKIKEIIEKLRYERDTYDDECEIFIPTEYGSKFTRKWICKAWQINMDIDRLEELMFDMRYNKHLVTEERISMLFNRISNKYGVEV